MAEKKTGREAGKVKPKPAANRDSTDLSSVYAELRKEAPKRTTMTRGGIRVDR